MQTEGGVWLGNPGALSYFGYLELNLFTPRASAFESCFIQNMAYFYTKIILPSLPEYPFGRDNSCFQKHLILTWKDKQWLLRLDW